MIDTFVPLGPPGMVRFSMSAGSFGLDKQLEVQLVQHVPSLVIEYKVAALLSVGDFPVRLW